MKRLLLACACLVLFSGCINLEHFYKQGEQISLRMDELKKQADLGNMTDAQKVEFANNIAAAKEQVVMLGEDMEQQRESERKWTVGLVAAGYIATKLGLKGGSGILGVAQIVLNMLAKGRKEEDDGSK